MKSPWWEGKDVSTLLMCGIYLIVIIVYEVEATLFSCVNDMCEGYDLITSEVCMKWVTISV